MWIGRVVDREEVGDPAEPLAGVSVVVRNRLIGDVRRRHHQRLADVGAEQMVQRRVGQHHAEVGATRRNPEGDGGLG